MGLLFEYFKNRWKEKRWVYVIDWILDIALMVLFIYVSWQLREYMLNCTCPFCARGVNFTTTNTSINIT